MPKLFRVLTTLKKAEIESKCPLTEKKLIECPSNALMPARYLVDTRKASVHSADDKHKPPVKREPHDKDNMNVEETSSDRVIDEAEALSEMDRLIQRCKSNLKGASDENTMSTYDSDEETESACETDGNAGSDSTIPEPNRTRKRRRRLGGFQVKEELSDTDEETDSKTRARSNNAVSTSPLLIRIKREMSNGSSSHVVSPRHPGNVVSSLIVSDLLSDKNGERQVSSSDENLHRSSKSATEMLQENSSGVANRQDNLSVQNQIAKTNRSVGDDIKTEKHDNRSRHAEHSSSITNDAGYTNGSVSPRSKRSVENTADTQEMKKLRKELVSDSPRAVSDGKKKAGNSIRTNESVLMDHVLPSTACASSSEPCIKKPKLTVRPNNEASEISNESVNKGFGDNHAESNVMANDCSDSVLNTPVKPVIENPKLDEKITVEHNRTLSANDSLQNESIKERINEVARKNTEWQTIAEINENGVENCALQSDSTVEGINQVVKGNSIVQTRLTVTECNQIVRGNSTLLIVSTSREGNRSVTKNSTLAVGSAGEGSESIVENSTLPLVKVAEEGNQIIAENFTVQIGSEAEDSNIMVSENVSQIGSADEEKTISKNDVVQIESTSKKGNQMVRENVLKTGSADNRSNQMVSKNDKLQIGSTVKKGDQMVSENLLKTGSVDNKSGQMVSENVLKTGSADNECNQTTPENSTLQIGSTAEEINQTESKNDSSQYGSTFHKDAVMTSSTVALSTSSSNCHDSSAESTADHVDRKFSTSIFKFLDLNTKIDKNDALECLDYLTAKYSQNESYSLFCFCEKTKVSDTREGKVVKSNLCTAADEETPSPSLSKPTNIPCSTPLISEIPEKVWPEYSNASNISVVSIEELKKIFMQTGVASFPVLYGSDSKNVSSAKICFVQPSLDANISSNLPSLSTELQKGGTGNRTVINAMQLSSANRTCGNDYSNISSAKTNVANSSLSCSDQCGNIIVVEQAAIAECNNDFKNICDNSCFAHRPSTEREVGDASVACTDKMQEIVTTPFIAETSQLVSGIKSVPCEIASSTKSSVEGDVMSASVTPTNELQIESTVIPESLKSNSDTKDISEDSCSIIVVHAEDRNAIIPSNEELEEIIMNVSLLDNVILSTPEETLNSTSEDETEDGNQSPDIEVIIQDGIDSTISSVPSIVNSVQENIPEIIEEEIELLKVKKKNSSSRRNISNITNQSEIQKDIAKDRTKKNKDIGSFQQIIGNAHNRSHGDTKDYIKKHKETDRFLQNIGKISSQPDTDRIKAKDCAKKNKDIGSFQVKKVDMTPSQYDASENVTKDSTKKTKDPINSKACKVEKKIGSLTQIIPSQSNTNETETKNCEKKIKITTDIRGSDKTPASRLNDSKEKNLFTANENSERYKAGSSCANLSTFDATDCSRITGKHNISDKTENKRKRVKLTSEETCQTEHVQTSRDPRILKRSVFKQTLFPSDRRFNIKLSPNEHESIFSHPPVSSSVTTQVSSRESKSSQDIHNRSLMSSYPMHSKVPSSENKHQDPLNFKEKRSASETNVQPSSKYVRGDHQGSEGNGAQVVFLGRRGYRASLSKCLYKNVGKHFIGINDLPSLILEWNAKWLLTQKETKKCAPICDGYESVKDTYKNELDYYNTYFPLHLLSIWLRMSDTWKKCPILFDSVYENQVEKPNFVKITCSTVLSLADFANWPKREDILLCKTAKPDGSVEEMFGRVCNVMAKDYNPPANSSLQGKAGALKRVRFEFFCAEALEAPLLIKVQIKILCNIRIALLKNDALQHLNNAMKEVILDPRKHGSCLSFIPLQPHRDPTFHRCVKSIVDSVMSPRIRVTLVDTSSPCDVVFAISQLAVGLMKKHSPVLIGVRSEDSFLRLANSLKHCNLILAVKKKEVKVPDELKKFTLEERLTVVPGREMFNKWHITLTLLSSIFLGEFTDAFAEQNLTCIVHESHLCTETETALLLYYDVKNLVLMGKHEVPTDVHPILKRFGYNISLFSRFCKAK